MKVSAVATLSSIALFGYASAAAVPASDAASLGVYSPMVWSGSVTPGGPEVELTGTLSEVVEQIIALNPDWEAQTDAAAAEAPVSPPKKALRWDGQPTCDKVAGDRIVSQYFLKWEVIPTLRRIGGNCGTKARNCARLSCSWSSGVELCNDRTSFVSIPCNQIADGAEMIANKCVNVKGQLFDTTGWNVVVRGSKC
ncbi:hypothetical protein DRE_05170 [Drechslerella stenobrocha 248]|uniref:Uncharacterized protein n=1 Tax=Drechslerella stenobrocha 248 TaxID=1043628 RepID=W7HR10_9PEZI|nr:hypothetical protein DRE_05170 [Drechslerella stenobrocha 248]